MSLVYNNNNTTIIILMSKKFNGLFSHSTDSQVKWEYTNRGDDSAWMCKEIVIFDYYLFNTKPWQQRILCISLSLLLWPYKKRYFCTTSLDVLKIKVKSKNNFFPLFFLTIFNRVLGARDCYIFSMLSLITSSQSDLVNQNRKKRDRHKDFSWLIK
jgi:hypothetical protein